MTEYLPVIHVMQSDSASLPIVSRYVPAGQFRHVVPDDDPFTTEYLPATQRMQSLNSLLPTVSRYVPAGQFRHVVTDVNTSKLA